MMLREPVVAPDFLLQLSTLQPVYETSQDIR